MIAEDINKLTEDLERQELESPNGIASSKVYEQLLAVYLYQHDLCNAKYLWKRIPADVKSSCPEIGKIWAVGQNMWKRDCPGIYKALNGVTWSDVVADIMKAVQEKIRKEAIDLISQAYSTISIDSMSLMTGLNPEAAVTVCLERGWHFEPDTRIAHPVKPSPEQNGQTSSEDQLSKLTDFVSFLEN